MIKDVQIQYITYEDIKHLKAVSAREHVSIGDDNKTKYLGAFKGGVLLGFVGWQIIGNSLRYKSDYVLPNYRCNGVYSLLFNKREEECENIEHKCITAFCTSKSLPAYLNAGFMYVSKNKNNITFVKR